MYCNICGVKLPLKSNFCFSCGCKIDSFEESSNEPLKVNKKYKTEFIDKDEIIEKKIDEFINHIDKMNIERMVEKKVDDYILEKERENKNLNGFLHSTHFCYKCEKVEKIDADKYFCNEYNKIINNILINNCKKQQAHRIIND